MIHCPESSLNPMQMRDCGRRYPLAKTGAQDMLRWTVRIISTLMLVLLCMPAGAQVTVTGVVQDAATRQPLVAAHVVAEAQDRGTITNNAGQFRIELRSLPATLVIRHLSYEAVRLEFGPNDSCHVTVGLIEAVYELDEVIVAGDEFAANLMRKVLEHKQRRRAHLQSWQSQGYSRVTIERGARIVLVSEHVFDAYRDAAHGPREVIRSRRETGTFYQDLGISPIPVDLSLDYIAIQGQQFIGPTHKDALDHYHYTFAGNRRHEGLTVYDLYIAPKAGLHAAVIGRIAILDSAYAMIEAEVRPARHLEYQPDVRLWEVSYHQQFAAVDSFWLPMGLIAEGPIHVDPDGVGVGPAGFRQVALLQNHQANVPLPPAPYAQAERTVVDEESVFRDDLFLLGRDIVALLPAEVQAHESLKRAQLTLRKALPSTDRARAPRAAVGATADGEAPQFVWPVIRGVEPWLRFNRVDGYFVGGGMAMAMQRGMAGARLAKSAGDNNTRLAAKFVRRITDRFTTTLAGGRETAAQQPSRIYSLALNSVNAQLGNGDYFDYYWRWWMRIRANYRLPWLRLSSAIRMESHLNMERSFTRAWPFRKTLPPNPPIATGTWHFLEAAAATGKHWQPFRMGPTHRAEVRFEQASSIDESYGRLELWLDTYLKTLLRKRPRPMGLSLRTTAMRSHGTVPPQGLVALDGTMGPVATLGTLRSLRTRRYFGRHALGVYWEHDFRTVLWEALGFRRLVQQRTGITLGGAHAKAWPRIGGMHHELTASLTEVFGTPLRLDLTRRLDQQGWHVSVGLSRMW